MSIAAISPHDTRPGEARRAGRGGVERVMDVMTRAVVTVGPHEPVHEAARRLLEHAVSGLPVVDNGALVGIVTAGDLAARLAPRRRLRWWQLLVDKEREAAAYRKTAGRAVADVMTAPAVSIAPAAAIEEAARLLATHRIGRLPVVTAAGVLAGIVSRRDLLPLLLDTKPATCGRGDGELLVDLGARLAHEPWISTRGLRIEVHGKVVSLYGLVDEEAERRTIELMARTLDGVRGVDSHLIVRSRLPGYAG
jgi:CBS domain-containing protein